MSGCQAVEPAPIRFYAPADFFLEEDLQRLGTVWVGDTIGFVSLWFLPTAFGGDLALSFLLWAN